MPIAKSNGRRLRRTKENRKNNDLLYFAGKETHDALIKNTEEQTIKQIIKYLKKRGYKVTK